jgi:hypothetical protein
MKLSVFVLLCTEKAYMTLNVYVHCGLLDNFGVEFSMPKSLLFHVVE